MKKISRFLLTFLCCAGLCYEDSATAGNGVIAGTGASILNYAPLTEAPHLQHIGNFLNRLESYEPTLVRLIKRFRGSNPTNPDPRDPKLLRWKKTPERCAEQNAPMVEKRAIYQSDFNYVWICKAYDELDEVHQVSTILHELLHYALATIRHEFADEEGWVFSVESELILPMLTADDATFAAYARQLGDLFDRNIPNLYAFSNPEAEVVLRNVVPFPIFENAPIAFPMPADFFSPTYPPKHFLAEFLSTHWARNPAFRANQLEQRSQRSETLHGVIYISLSQDAAGNTKGTTKESTAEQERTIALNTTSGAFQNFFARYKLLTGRQWISDGTYFYFFE